MKLAVLELRNEAQLTPAEVAYLTDRVRDAASRVLPGERFLVMTRESIIALLPPGRNLADCTAADCEIEMGRALGVDYLISGEVLRFAGKLRLNLKAHHCLSGAFLGSEAAGGATLEELESATRQTAPALLTLVRRHAGGGETGDTGPGATGPAGAYGETPAQTWRPAARRTTVVSFDSDPPGAVVLADDQLLCQATPCSRNLPAGILTVSMQKERYVSRKETVAIPADGSLPRIAWKLTPDFGWLTVASDPDSVIVTINGEPAGRTPLARRELPPGAYDVKCADGRFFEKGERFTLSRGEDRVVRLTPAPREGAIEISAIDSQGNAVIGTLSADGHDVGPVPGTYKLLVGHHAVSVIATDDRWVGTVDIAEGQISEVKAKVEVVAAFGLRRALARGQELMEKAATAVGAKSLAGLKGWHRRQKLSATIQGIALDFGVEETVVLPDRMRVVQTTAFGNMTQVINGQSGWSESPRGRKIIGAEEAAKAYKAMDTEILRILRDHALLPCQALEPMQVDGRTLERVYVTSAGGDYLLYYLDAVTGLPAIEQTKAQSPVTNAEVTQQTVYGEYRLFGGLKLAKTVTIKHDGEVFATGTLESFEANPVASADTFK